MVQITLTQKQFRAVSMCVLTLFAEYDGPEHLAVIANAKAQVNIGALTRAEREEIARTMQAVHRSNNQRG